jgi:penicillin amidase/acyl-homoserine-lactone acylase
MIKKISSACLLFTILSLVLGSCSTLEQNSTFEISNQYNVYINRDFWGVPYIKGQTDQDVAYGIGLVHAEDAYEDLVELMPLYRGQNAIYNGLDSIDTDYLVRLLKVHSKVRNIGKKQLSQNILSMAQAYADGVNAYAKEHPDKVKPSLHPITQEDVLAGSYIQHLFFAGLDRDLAQMAAEDKTSIPTGSNAIAINSIKADSNAAYLLINSHQPLSGPVGWYELNIESKSGWHGHGGNFPGSFLINVGFNKDIGWGATVNRPDVMDIFELTINPENSNQYLLDDKWESFEIEEDYLAFKLFGFLKLRTKQKFRYSKFGPVLEMKGRYFALRHINQSSFNEIEGWYEIGNSTDVYEFEKQLAKRKIPSFNFVTMDSNRNIGYFYNGRIPVRADAPKARQILRSSSSNDIWDDGKLVHNLPKFINPSNGWIQSTNQNPFSVMGNHSLKMKSMKKNVHFEQRLTNRSFVANELLSSDESISLDRFIEIKFDNSYSKNSRQYKYLESIAQYDENIKLALQNWNRKTDIKNTNAGLGMCFMAQEWISEMNSKPTPSHKLAKQECDSLFQKIQRNYSDQWGLINTISRGSRTYPIQGSVDTLRAVYGSPNSKTKSLNMSGGDGLFYIIAEDDDGRTIYGMHNYGSSRNESSAHYSDQTFLFSQEALRFIPTSL